MPSRLLNWRRGGPDEGTDPDAAAFVHRATRGGGAGSTLAAVLADLDRQYPGMRFRMLDEQEKLRPHVRFFVRGEAIFDLATPLQASDELVIVQALSGG